MLFDSCSVCTTAFIGDEPMNNNKIREKLLPLEHSTVHGGELLCEKYAKMKWYTHFIRWRSRSISMVDQHGPPRNNGKLDRHAHTLHMVKWPNDMRRSFKFRIISKWFESFLCASFDPSNNKTYDLCTWTFYNDQTHCVNGDWFS